MEIVPNVHRIDNANGSNVMLLVDDRMAVIDTGVPGNAEVIQSYIRSLGRDPKDLSWILLTHFHNDHSGSAAELHAATGAKVVAHQAETERNADGKLLLRKGNEGERPPMWYRWLFGRGRGRRQEPTLHHDTEVHETVTDEDTIPCLGGIRIIFTPGHTPGSICPLVLGPGALFLGDSVLNNIDRLSRPLMWDRSRRQQLDGSLSRLRNLEAQSAFFGHGPPITESVMDKIRGLTDRPYDISTWRIVLRNRRTLRQFRANSRRSGHWQGGPRS